MVLLLIGIGIGVILGVICFRELAKLAIEEVIRRKMW